MSVAVALVSLLGGGCHPNASNRESTAPTSGRAEDAGALPTFATGPEEPQGPERFFVEVGDAPFRGPVEAPVTVIMFSDFECPFCLQGYETLERLGEKYGDRVRLVYKAFPLDIHENALVLAMAARSAQAQDRFWEFHDLLFKPQASGPEHLLDLARSAGLDLDALVRDVESLEYGPEVYRDMRQGRRLGVSSTPTFFINGRLLTGAKPLEAFEAIVDEELGVVQKWRAEGLPADHVYAHAIKDGYRRVEYSEGQRGLDPDEVVAVPIGDSPTRGPANAEVTIVAFEDFECPFCVRGHEALAELERIYPDRLRFVFKHNPLHFHRHAFTASRAAMVAAEQGKFWEYHDRLYARGAAFDDDALAAIAQDIGLDMPRFLQRMSKADLDARIEVDLELAAAIGVTGTPAYFINGRPVEGAMPLLHFRLIVEEEMDRARDALARGVEPSSLYDTLSRQPLE